MSSEFAELEAILTRQTWFLLHYGNGDGKGIRAELSLAAEMTTDKFVSRWAERIILTEDRDGSDLANPISEFEVGSDDDEIDIPVLKKE